MPPTKPAMIPTNTPMFNAGEPSTDVKYPSTAISCPNKVWVTAFGSASISLVTPKIAPVIELIKTNAMIAANAPPALSFDQSDSGRQRERPTHHKSC